MSFRKIPFRTRFVEPSPVYERQLQTVFSEENGTDFKQIVEVDVTDLDASAGMPTPSEYTLANLLAAKIPLEKVPTNVLTDNSVDGLNNGLENFMNNNPVKEEE